MSDKPTARSYSASAASQKAAGPLAWGDKCFLCGQQIGESDPRGFYTGTHGNAMMLAHRGCLNTFEANGNTWPEKAAPPKPYEPIPITIEPAVELSFAGTQIPFAGARIRFDSFDHMQSFVAARGPIPGGVEISVGGQVICDGR